MIFLTCIYSVLLSMKNAQGGGPPTCGIPVFQWHCFFFGMLGLRSMISLCKIYTNNHSYFRRGHLEFFKLILLDGVIIGWLVYGNKIYYSKDNNCNLIEGTKFMADLMQTILFLGYIMMGFYMLILCTLPCLYLYIQAHANMMANRLGPGQIREN